MDKLIKSLAQNGHFRAFVLDATGTVRRAQEIHETLPTSTVALGRTLMAAQILGANEKGDTKITVKVIGDGAIGAVVAVADSRGDVKGYIHNTELDYKRVSTGRVLVGELMGNGQFIVIKDLGLRTPYTGQVDLITGEIGDDLAWYFLSSEQTPSSVGLSVMLDDDNQADTVSSATGFLLQAMPDATDDEISEMEANIKAMPSLDSYAGNLYKILSALYGSTGFKVLEEMPLQFSCDCSRERFAAGIKSLPTGEITAMIEEDDGAEVICQFCGKDYHYSAQNLNQLILEKSNG